MYRQKQETPDIGEYRDLRERCKLSPKSVEASERGLANSLFATTIRENGKLIAMGRVVGDDGCNYEVVDIAVHPDYQRQGLGQEIMGAIMSYIERNAPDSAYVSLIADHHSPALYSKFGFKPTAPISIGMAMQIRR